MDELLVDLYLELIEVDDRFRHISIESGGEDGFSVVLHGMGRKRNDRRFLERVVRPQPLEGLNAIDIAGEADVEDDEVGPETRGDL